MTKSPLQKKYDIELSQIDKDITYLDTRFDDHTEQIAEIEALSIASDASYAQTVVDANSYLSQAENFGLVAAGCGCSVGAATTVFYEVARAKMRNVNIDPNYGGDSPNENVGTVNLTNTAGSSTTLNPGNYGQGYRNVVEESTEEAAVRYITVLQPSVGICSQTCSELYTAQQQALTNHNNAKTGPERAQYGEQSGIIKKEAQEYRNQRWAMRKGKSNSESRRDRIKNFYPNAGPSGIGT